MVLKTLTMMMKWEMMRCDFRATCASVGVWPFVSLFLPHLLCFSVIVFYYHELTTLSLMLECSRNM